MTATIRGKPCDDDKTYARDLQANGHTAEQTQFSSGSRRTLVGPSVY